MATEGPALQVVVNHDELRAIQNVRRENVLHAACGLVSLIRDLDMVRTVNDHETTRAFHMLLASAERCEQAIRRYAPNAVALCLLERPAEPSDGTAEEPQVNELIELRDGGTKA
jgi:hypothetical protein